MWSKVVRISGVVIALGVVLIVALASAEKPSPLARTRAALAPSQSSEIDLWLEDAHGQRLRTFQHRGRSFVVGSMGERYAIRVTNRSRERVEAVITVDGRDAISGRAGDYVTQRGYIVAPHDSVLVQGFRQSLASVATFRFSDVDESYSARMGTPENVGVVGVAVFKERRRPARVEPAPAAEQARRAPRRAPRLMYRDAPGAASPDTGAGQNIGTEYGESRRSVVYTTGFERAHPSSPAWIVTLYYDDARGLEARGIDVLPSPVPAGHSPDPFPQSQFAPPPPPRR